MIYRNRQWALARLLGRSYPRHWPRIALRDGADLAGALLHGEARRAWGILSGWLAAGRHLPSYAHVGAPKVSVEMLRRFEISPGLSAVREDV